MLRLFVALEISDDARGAIAEIGSGLPDARWVAPENLHVTLRFIGEVDDPVAEEVDAELIGLGGRALTLTLAGLDCFESRDRVRAVWVRVAGGDDLIQLQRSVEFALRRAGVAPDTHKFVPHVTVARLRNVAVERVVPYLQHHGDFRVPPFAVSRFTLFRSHMGRGGSHYEPLVYYDLAR